MLFRSCIFVLALALLGSSGPASAQTTRLQYTAEGNSPELLATYEAWFGGPGHIAVGYSSDDSHTIEQQIEKAKQMGIQGFVVDWYGDREPWIDHNYALLQKIAEKKHFQIAVLYDEAFLQNGDTDQVIADLNAFRDKYLGHHSPGHKAYLTFENRPMIFIYPDGQTDWDRVRAALNDWKPAPLLIMENVPNKYLNDFDGFYPWVSPGPKGWSPDGSNWGEQYLTSFYQDVTKRAAGKIIVGGAWAAFDDNKASWGQNRHIAARCGQTLRDTMDLWRKYVPPGQAIPFLMIETWNDYEEGSAIESGLPACGGQPQPNLTVEAQGGQPLAEAR